MNTLADYSEPALMIPCLRSVDAAMVTAELCSTLHRQQRVVDLLPFYHAVVDRESVSSTAISPGLALPHTRCAGIPQLCFALGRALEPLVWFGGEPVNLVFLFAVPESQVAAYLGLISGLAKLSQDRLRLERLGDAPDSGAMFEVLRQIPLSKHTAATIAA